MRQIWSSLRPLDDRALELPGKIAPTGPTRAAIWPRLMKSCLKQLDPAYASVH